jgi:bacteriorhodopsin
VTASHLCPSLWLAVCCLLLAGELSKLSSSRGKEKASMPVIISPYACITLSQSLVSFTLHLKCTWNQLSAEFWHAQVAACASQLLPNESSTLEVKSLETLSAKLEES